MNYELAKELKDNGFPLRKCEGAQDWKGQAIFKIYNDAYFFPTLSELIEACLCRDAYFRLNQSDSGWIACLHNKYLSVITSGQGSTPEEAVARLWLALNRK